MSNNVTLNTESRAVFSTSNFPSNEFDAKQYVEDFIDKYHLPVNAEISFNRQTNQITVIWRGKEMDVFRDLYPIQFHQNDCLWTPVEKAKFKFNPDQTISLETGFFGQAGWRGFSDRFIVQKGSVTANEGALLIEITEHFQADNRAENQALYSW